MSISLHSTNITVEKKNIVMKKLYAALIIMVSYTVTISCVGQGGYLFDVINNTENMVDQPSPVPPISALVWRVPRR